MGQHTAPEAESFHPCIPADNLSSRPVAELQSALIAAVHVEHGNLC